MRYKVPNIPTHTGLTGIDKRIQQIQIHMAANLSWLQYSFGACQRVLKQVEDSTEVIPVCYINKTSDPLDMRPWLDDSHTSYSFWDILDTPFFEYSDNTSFRKSPAITNDVACIIVVNLSDVNSNLALARSTVRQRILKYFNQQVRFSGVLFIENMHEKDIEAIFDGYDIADPLLFLRHNYAAFRVEMKITFKQDCLVAETTDFSSWYLGSLDEMQLVHDNLHAYGIGGFTSSEYWSSSEQNATSSYSINFSTGITTSSNKNSTLKVRHIRSFTSEAGAYLIRNVGPGGGYIFYIDGTTYYEAAESDVSDSYYWSNIQDVAVTGTGTAIGTGLANTAAIIGQAGHITSAADLCRLQNIGEKSAWHLPSKLALDQMDYLVTNGYMSAGIYWSSSETSTPFPATQSWARLMESSYLSTNKSDLRRVRAIRTVTAEPGTYSIGDVAPGGGYFFYIDNLYCYEGAPDDVSTSHVWSNIASTAIGSSAQGTGIARGITNTAAIIGQAGHTDSAAKLCNDYSV